MRRLPLGGAIDRSRPLGFTWDGRAYEGYAGDTLASALLGSGVDIIGTSVSLGRPRGVMSAGMEEASAFAQVVSGEAPEPLLRMTAITLYDGLAAESRLTRGYLAAGPDAARFDKRYHHCDVFVVGAGAAGLTVALAATLAGQRVVLVEADDRLGGALLRDHAAIDGSPLDAWLTRARDTLANAPDTLVLTSATAAVALDQNGMIVVQRLGSALSRGDRRGLPEQRLWHIRAATIVLATGALERPLVFQNNDLPGIMLAGGARSYAHRYALVPERGLVFTTTDDGYRTALAWHTRGVSVAAIVDPRADAVGPLARQAEALGVRIVRGAVVERALADDLGRLRGAVVRSAAGREEMAAEVMAVSGGFEPSLNLHLQCRGATRFDHAIGAPVPEGTRPGQWVVGAAAGHFALSACIRDGGRAAADVLGAHVVGAMVAPPTDDDAEEPPSDLWRVPAPDGDESRSFVDLHRDGTVADVLRAAGAGLRHIEHIKRYTLIGTGVEQGRSAKLNAGALTAALTSQPLAEVGMSGSRPPVEPIVFAALGGRASGPRFEPIRTTSMHHLHEATGAAFDVVGQWLRPNHFPRRGERKAEAVARECTAARRGVALMDASTLGKIDVRGPDATWFLEQLYVNPIATLPVSKGRYSVLCRMDGSVFDDGVVLRLADQRYLVTTSTGHAAAVLGWMEEWLQTEWPDRRVWVTSVTEQFATIALVGPRSRAVLARIAPKLDLSVAAFPFLAVRQADLADVGDAMIARVSFSGELAFELSLPWHDGPVLWQALLAAGENEGITPYGLEALQTLRTEKGFVIVGQDTEALTTPYDAGLGWLVDTSRDFVGKRSLARSAPRREDRPQLVGFAPVSSGVVVPEGAGLVAHVGAPPLALVGHVTSSYFSHSLGHPIGLALVNGGRARLGETLFAHVMTDGAALDWGPVGTGKAATPAPRRPMRVDRQHERFVEVRLVSPVHYDPTGGRRDG